MTKYERTPEGKSLCPHCGKAYYRGTICVHIRRMHPEHVPTTPAISVEPEARVTARELAALLAEARKRIVRPALPPPPPTYEPPRLPPIPVVSFWRCADCDSNTHAPSVRDPQRCTRCVTSGPPPPKPERLEGRLYCQDCGAILPRECDKRRLYCDACGVKRSKASDQRRNRRWLAKRAEVDA